MVEQTKNMTSPRRGRPWADRTGGCEVTQERWLHLEARSLVLVSQPPAPGFQARRGGGT